MSRASGHARLWLLLLASPPILVGLLPSSAWTTLSQALFLPEFSQSKLLLFSFFPICAHLLLRTGLLATGEGARSPLAWLVASGVTTLLASRHLDGGLGEALCGGAAGFAWCLAPLWLARKAGLAERQQLLVDSPALAVLALYGWSGGLFASVIWRWLALSANASLLRSRAPRQGAVAILLLLFFTVPAAELTARETLLGTAWDAREVHGERASDWQKTPIFWTEFCGSQEASRQLSIAWAGGSSTGGAWQLGHDPEAFFASLVHRELCQQLPKDTALRSFNYGGQSRDTFTISRSADALLEESAADVLVLYVGHNDLFTANNPVTRKEQEAAVLGAGPVERFLREAADRSRLVTGAGLLWRLLVGSSTVALDLHVQGYPSAVPLPDAEENLRQIAAETRRQDAQLWLVTQWIDPNPQVLPQGFPEGLGPYWALESRLAEEIDGVYLVEGHTLGDRVSESEAPPSFLLDLNHLSVEGHRALAELLTPQLRTALGMEPQG